MIVMVMDDIQETVVDDYSLFVTSCLLQYVKVKEKE